MLPGLTPHVRFLARAAVSVCVLTSVLIATLTLTRATAASGAAMSCCTGGSSHCNSEMMAEVGPPSEPICGAEPAGEFDEDTIVAEPTNDEFESTSEDVSDQSLTLALTAPCATDCCSLVWSSFKRPTRDFADRIARKVEAQSFNPHAKPRISLAPLPLSKPFDLSIPRGPPTLDLA